MPIRSSDAAWEGTLKSGSGTMRFSSGAYEGHYSFSSRFENGSGTNPEELVAAAEAGCFSMALAADLEKAGYSPQRVATTADVHINKEGEGWAIPQIDLRTEAEVESITDEEFQRIAEGTKRNCPVSQLLSGSAQITLEAKLSG